MKWLKKQNRLTKDFLSGEFSSVFWMCAAAFGILIVLGFIAGLINEDFAADFVGRFTQQVDDMGVVNDDGTVSAAALFSNNLRATVFTILYGIVPFVFLPAIALGTNTILLGAFAAYYVHHKVSLLTYLAALIPHGIFEFPALVLAIALGIYLCKRINFTIRTGTKGVVRETWGQILRVLVLRLIPLLLVASVVEAYVTPLIVNLLV